jgi:hypothetical protein
MKSDMESMRIQYNRMELENFKKAGEVTMMRNKNYQLSDRMNELQQVSWN